MAKRSKAWGTRRIYEFIKAHRHEHDVQTMCSALEVTRSGYSGDPALRKAVTRDRRVWVRFDH
jgi:hypothetical protein